MPEKNISDTIQNILDKNKGFVLLSNLPALLSNEVRQQLGIKKSKETAGILQKKIEAAASEGQFMFRKKGAKTYILTPCEPSELVLGLLSSKKPFDMKTINTLPFTKPEVIETVNVLVEAGQAKITLTKDFKPQIFRAEAVAAPKPSVPAGYTPEAFREAFDLLDNGRIFVRIPDLRRMLNWPRNVFDQMLRDLRDKSIIQLHTADASTMKGNEVEDCFIDENNFRMGTVTYNVK